MLTKKTLTRRVLVQFFYSYFFNLLFSLQNNSILDLFKLFIKNFELEDGFEEINFEFSEEIISAFSLHKEDIFQKIKKIATEHPIEKIPLIDKSIIFLAILEMLYISEKTPFKVATDEAIELAKFFKDESSASFINGVLAKIIDDENLEK